MISPSFVICRRKAFLSADVPSPAAPQPSHPVWSRHETHPSARSNGRPGSVRQNRPMNTKQSRPLALAIAVAVAVTTSTQTAPAVSLDDIQLWAGSGNNRAALVIDWNSGSNPESFVWGYRWDGTASGLDMIQAVVAADPRLHAHFSDFSFGRSLLGIGYDLNNDGAFAVDPALSFDSSGLAIGSGSANANDARTATHPADLYREGWNSGFWAYYLKSDGSEDWSSALTGSADRTLLDGAWDGYSFAAAFNSSAPDTPAVAAIPEPAPLSLLLAGFITFSLHTRTRRQAR